MIKKYPPSLEEQWYERRHYLDGSSCTSTFCLKEHYKVCLITDGQMCSVIEKIKELRDLKDYGLADQYRDKLLDVGFFYDFDTYMTKVIPAFLLSAQKSKEMGGEGSCASLPLLHRHDKMRLAVVDGEVTLHGWVNYGGRAGDSEETFYSTGRPSLEHRTK